MTTSIKKMTEQELRGYKVPTPRSIDELTNIICDLTERKHDYGTCVYAMSIAATAAFNYMASTLGVTGFQASCADMDVLRRTRGYEHGFQVIKRSQVADGRAGGERIRRPELEGLPPSDDGQTGMSFRHRVDGLNQRGEIGGEGQGQTEQ